MALTATPAPTSIALSLCHPSPKVIRLAVLMYVKYPLSLRNVGVLLHDREFDISHETVRYLRNRFGSLFAYDIRRQRAS